MLEHRYPYIIIGGGLAGASAVKGIRQGDPNGSILLLGQETVPPYHRPPLTKGLWTGKKKEPEIYVQDNRFYEENGVTLHLGCPAVSINARNKELVDFAGKMFSFEKLLICTGGFPRRLPIPGGDLPDISYYRTLDDYHNIRAQSGAGKSALVIGGGFIGSEIAAALSMNGMAVSMVFPEAHLCSRVFPEPLGSAVEQKYLQRNVCLLPGRRLTAIVKEGDRFKAQFDHSGEIEADIVIVGIGIAPETGLAQSAGLRLDNGIAVNEMLQTSCPWIYAAGDNAQFPYQALGRRMRVEHWDNALNQGAAAGRNMAGLNEPYLYMPYFFSDLFEFGYEAVGDVDSSLEIVPDWQKENDTGVLHYLRDGRIVGALMCNVWEKVEEERKKIVERVEMVSAA